MHDNEFDLSIVATEAIAQWQAVTEDTPDGLQRTCKPATTGDTPLGIALAEAAAGQPCPIRWFFECKGIAGGPITAGQLVAVDSSGKLTLATGADPYVVGQALQSASANDVFLLHLDIRPYVEADVIVDDSTISNAGNTLHVKAGGLDHTHLAAGAAIVGTQLSASAAIAASQLAAGVTSKIAVHERASGDLTASVSSTLSHVARSAGLITDAGFALGNTGADASDALTLELDITINGTSIFTTKPKLSKTAADAASTFAAGTGVTEGVIDAAKNILVAGDLIAYALTLVRTTPEDEMADAFVQYEVSRKVGA